jgi:hypothetical protein
MLIGFEVAVLVIPLVVVLTVIVAGCEAVTLAKLAGIATAHVIVVILVGVAQVLFISGQLGLLITTEEFALNPVPVIVAVNPVPAVHDAGETLLMLTGCTRVRDVASLTFGLLP